MDAATPDQIAAAIAADAPMRLGRKLLRTLYLQGPDGPDADVCVGIVDSEDIAREMARRWNAARCA